MLAFSYTLDMFETSKKHRSGLHRIFTVRDNRDYEKFKLAELTPNMFKYLIFTQGHIAKKNKKRRRSINRNSCKAETKPSCNLTTNIRECERNIKFKTR